MFRSHGQGGRVPQRGALDSNMHASVHMVKTHINTFYVTGAVHLTTTFHQFPLAPGEWEFQDWNHRWLPSSLDVQALHGCMNMQTQPVAATLSGSSDIASHHC